MIDTKRKYGKMRKDEYEHLVSTFFDSKKKQLKEKNIGVYIIAVVIITLIACVVSYVVIEKKGFSQSYHISPDKSPLTVVYDFRSSGKSKIRSVSLDLENIDASHYRYLALSIRTHDKSRIDSSIRVQIENEFSEKDSSFIAGVNQEWKVFTLPLTKFKRISDWTKISSLTFIIDEWNASKKKDVVYIDEIRFFD